MWSGANSDFINGLIQDLFVGSKGSDISKQFDALELDPQLKSDQLACIKNLYYIGKVDHRNSAQCLFSRYVLLAFSTAIVAVIGFKFLAALQLGTKREPEEHDKFVICQVPCYTESEDSMKKTLDSLAILKYDDKRKLLFIVCDGMIVGSGNDRPTPRIVLDLLGVDPNLDPEPLSFLSLGDGAKQHNMGKIYSGFIPKKKWSDYEQELWEVNTEGSQESERSRVSDRSSKSNRSNRSRSNTYSINNYSANSIFNAGVYNGGGRPGSRAGSTYGKPQRY
ncbi:8316_t:CDS:2 [Entrophospora sp. SA101]|nr:8316_t:CDS:2 [Entrophospora sp. SA101]